MDDLSALCTQFEELGEAPQESKEVVSSGDLKPTDIELMKLRAKCSDIQLICHYHIRKFLSAFEDRQRTCCDPFKEHRRNVRKSLKSVSLSFSKKYQKYWIDM
jgi:hypothetical protein